MRKFLKGMLIFIGGFILLAYLLFLVVPPVFINPAKYKADIQQVVAEACGLNLDFKKARIITTPLLGVGLKADGLTEVSNLHYIDRGYQEIEKVLSSVGANIKRV